MADPLVCAICLTRDQPEMAARAVRCFREQTYQNKRLLIYDNGKEQGWSSARSTDQETYFRCFYNAHRGMLSIGTLRNEANGHADDAPDDPEILIHWDDDDVSHPNRIAEQAALLQSSGAECVGYSEMLFWREPSQKGMPGWSDYQHHMGEAWLYTAPAGTAPGTSLCYWRSTWERRSFPDVNRGEDVEWLKGIELMAVAPPVITHAGHIIVEPPMIATIHGGNTSSRVDPASPNWRRVPEWDSYCRERCAL